MDWSIVEQYLPLYQKAFFLTLHIAVWGILGSFLLGLIVSIIRHYRIPVLAQVATAYIELSRNTPLLIQLFFLYFGLPRIGIVLLGPIKTQGWDKKEVTEEALQLLDRVGLLDKQHSFARQLSGGQKQRVAIVRALLMHPEIILFDEVTASLDPEMVREVLELINDLAQEGRTMILVTHEMQFAQAIADRIIFLDQGKIAEEGTAQAFFTNPQTKRAQEFLNVFDFS